MFVTLQLSADLAALLCGTLMRAAEQYPDSPYQRELFERVEAAINVAQYYCPDHKYNPPPNSGITLCPQCEVIAGNWGRE